MPFNNAKNFVVHADKISMIDNSSGEGKEQAGNFQQLYESACHGAGHKTAECFDPPKCHEETRIAVINEILSWANDTDPDQRIMWMNGPAGAGKSAIAQTVAETCEEDMLVASFFFSRTASTTGRDDGTRIIASLAYQMAVHVPETKPFVLKALQDNPAILKYSMEEQMRKLIVEPLTAGIADTRASRTIPELVIIDGLDECHDPKIQVSIINTLALAVSRLHVPLRFLVASRPELEIRKTFGSPVLYPISHKLVLDERYNPGEDIETYLRSEFHVIRSEHPSLLNNISWPSDDDIDSLVRKSSGQFIYASTVMKYISNNRKNPKKLLEVIINITPSPDNPYAQLDALYTHILSNCQQDYSLVKRLFEALLSKNMLRDKLRMVNAVLPSFLCSLPDYGDFICVDDIDLIASDLHSILDVGESGPRLYHASFSDFLNDVSRSRKFFISGNDPDATFVRLCLARIQKGHDRQESIPSGPLLYACASYFPLVLGCPTAERHVNHGIPPLVVRLQSKTPRHTTETAIRYLVLSPFGFFLQPVLEFSFSSDRRMRYRLPRTNGKPPLHPSYSISMKAFTLRLIPRPYRLSGVFPGNTIKTTFKHIQDAAKEYTFDYFKRNSNTPDRSRTYLRVIYDGLLHGSHPEDFTFRMMNRSKFKSSVDIIWLGQMLECPLHGKEYFLSAENSENLFRIIWEERWPMLNVISKGDGSRSPVDEMYPEEYIALPATLHYLLRRCNISTTFRSYLQKISPGLETYLLDISQHIGEILGASRTLSDASSYTGTLYGDSIYGAEIGGDERDLNSSLTKLEFERDRSLLLQFNFG